MTLEIGLENLLKTPKLYKKVRVRTSVTQLLSRCHKSAIVTPCTMFHEQYVMMSLMFSSPS